MDRNANRKMPMKKIIAPSRIVTTRLILERHQHDDFADCVAMWQDPEVVRLIRDRPFDASETWSRVLRCVGHWEFTGFGYWTIRDREQGTFCGELGFAQTHRAMPPGYADLPEFGCTLARHAWGRRIGTEAGTAALAWMRRHGDANRVVAITDENNAAALAMARSLGFQRRQRMTYDARDFCLMEHALTQPVTEPVPAE